MERFITASEVAKIFGVHVKTVYDWIDHGYLPFTQFKKPNGRLFFKESDIKNLSSTRKEARDRLDKHFGRKNAAKTSRT